MRKNRVLLLAIVLILVMAISVTTLVGCKDKGGTKVVINEEKTNEGATYFLNQASMYTAFSIESDYNSISDLVKVTDSTGAAIEVVIKREGDKVFSVRAPEAGYVMGKQYDITVAEGAKFKDYPEYTKVHFTITSDSYSNITLNSGVRQFNKTALRSEVENTTDDQGVTYSTLTLNTAGDVLDPNSIIVIYDEDKNEQKAYKVQSCERLSGEGFNSLVSVAVCTPEVEEVFASFEYHDVDEIEEDQIDFVVEKTEEELNNAEIANSIFTFFGSAPTFNVNAAFENGVVIVTITITIPNVVQTEGFGTSDLTITIKNELSADIVSDINIKNLKEMLSTKDFNIFAKVSNKMTSTVSFGAVASYEKITNVRQLVEKLQKLSDDDDTSTSVPIFMWTLPIGGGAANFTYQADLVFRFSFAGAIEAKAVSTMSYECGVAYTQADGLTPYQSQFKYTTDSVEAKVYGRATVKIGVAQAVGFNVMGILGVGIQAELGNFNSLYGQAESGNLLVDTDISGGIYFEGGFYYDVDLTFGLKIGTVINLNQKVDIVAGEIPLYSAGNRYYDAGVTGVAQTTNLTVTASTQKLPTYKTRVFDLKANVYSDEVIDVTDTSKVEFKTKNSTNYVIDQVNGTLVLTDSATSTFQEEYIMIYKDAEVKTTINFNAANPILNTNTVKVNKDNVKETSDEKITVTFAAGADVSVDGIDAKVEGKEITISKYALLQLPNGVNSVTVKVNSFVLPLNIEVSGTVSIYAEQTASGAYSIFAPDQIVAMASGGTFRGESFILANNIDMYGAEIAPIVSFEGTLEGAGYTISNYTVTSTVNNSAAFFAENKGSISNLKLAGNVNVSISAKTGKTYNVAGAVAVNNGTIDNVEVLGNVTATNTSLAGYNQLNVAGLVAVNNSTITNSTVNQAAAIEAIAKFDILGNNIYVGAYTATENNGIEASLKVSCAYGAKKQPIITKYSIAK